MAARVYGAAAPGATGQLRGCATAAKDARPVAATAALNGVGALVSIVGCGALADPEAQPKRLLAPALVAARRRIQANALAGADQRGSALELLQGEQAQRIAHQHCHTRLAGAPLDCPLQAAHGERI